MVSTLPPPPPIETRVADLHRNLREQMPGIVRIAIAVYDSKTDLLKTFSASDTGRDNPLPHHQAKLEDIESLRELAQTRQDRVIQDLRVLEDARTRHSEVVREHFGSSYTRPLFEGTHLRGFLFYDAEEKDYFTPSIVQRLSVYSELAGLLLASALHPARLLQSAIHAASHVSHTRDPETGAHLERMARYSRRIALEMAEERGLSSAYLEHLLTFAPLHDVGKVGVPDAILLKPGRLDDDELATMRTHVALGVEMIDDLLDSLGLEALPYVDMLRDIILCHHEAWDGSGYPQGLAGEEIPIAARIVTVADVFDALTSERPYKAPWSWDRARAFMKDQSGRLFDPACVAAFERAWDDLREIRATFPDDSYGMREGYTDEV